MATNKEVIGQLQQDVDWLLYRVRLTHKWSDAEKEDRFLSLCEDWVALTKKILKELDRA